MAVLVAGCGGGSSKAAVVITTTSAVGPTSASPTTTLGVTTVPVVASTSPVTSAAVPDPLEPLLITAVPAGYVQQADSVGDTGPSDLAKAISDDGNADAQTVLTKDGFVHGYQRLWQNAGQNQIVLFLYQFSAAAGATSYAERSVSQVTSDPSVKTTSFSVPGVPTAVGLEATDSNGSGAVVVFDKGVYLVQIAVNGATPTGLAALAQQVAADQYKRL
jgi:hypothetical protein